MKMTFEERCRICEQCMPESDFKKMMVSLHNEMLEAINSLSFDDALKLAKGCTDYGGGYRDESYEIYQHGIGTVINVLNAAKQKGISDMQLKVLHHIGSKA
jgi:hypothetical protein